MLFSTPIFIFLFLPIFLLVYFLLGKKLRNFFILVASIVFYTWSEGWLILIMLISMIVSYITGLVISKGLEGNNTTPLKAGTFRTKKQKVVLISSIIANLLFLGFFKYFNFGLENFNYLINFFGWQRVYIDSFMQIILPLGISYYTFQLISYTVDVYRGTIAPTRNFINFASFIAMFPHIIAGPIVRYTTIARQLVFRVITRESFVDGIKRFIVGFGKKMLIANTLAFPVDTIFSLPTNALTASLTWIGVVCYSLQIYFDFSGYSDMAIGLGKMLGFTFLENFNYPYIAQSIKEFWRRWHISLSTWFRDYLYIPLGGNRKSSGRTYVNLFIVFIITGLWHGANWTFVAWGLFHGFFIVLERLGLLKFLQSLWRPLRHAYFILVILISWAIFRSDSLGYAFSYLKAMFGFGKGRGTVPQTTLSLNAVVLIALAAGIIGSTNVFPLLKEFIRKTIDRKAELNSFYCNKAYFIVMVVFLLLIFITSLMQLATSTYNPFIYFRF